MRKLLLNIHLWGGLILALPLIVVSFTGAFLVWGDAIDRERDRQLYYVTPGPTQVPAQQLLESVLAAYPKDKLMGTVQPEAPNLSFVCAMQSRNYVHVNQYTGQILGARHLESSWRRKLFLLHSRLMAGEIGHNIVVVTTAFSIFFIISGIILWWKFKIFGLKARTSWWGINFDLHSVLGLYSSVVFFVLALTGIFIAYDKVVYPVFQKWGGGEPSARVRLQSGPDTGKKASLDDVIAAAERALPGARLGFIGFPRKPTDVYHAYMKFPEEPTTSGRSRVFVDRYTAAVVGTRDARKVSWGVYAADVTEAIHFGDIWGMPTRILAFLVSLFVSGQVISGFLIWWKKK